jgi:hypothetical protein
MIDCDGNQRRKEENRSRAPGSFSWETRGWARRKPPYRSVEVLVVADSGVELAVKGSVLSPLRFSIVVAVVFGAGIGRAAVSSCRLGLVCLPVKALILSAV